MGKFKVFWAWRPIFNLWTDTETEYDNDKVFLVLSGPLKETQQNSEQLPATSEL